MKRIICITFMFSLLLMGGMNVFAQDESSKKAEKAKQAASAEAQERAILEQERELHAQEREVHAQERAIDARERAEEAARSSSRSSARSSSRVRSSGTSGTAYYFSDGDDSFSVLPVSEGSHFFSTQGSSSSNLNLSKTYKGETKENSGSFQVDESVRHINLNISGNVQTGSITIKILLSNGKVFKEVELDDSANMSFNQSIRISEEETKYYGDWEYVIKANKAEGRYMMQIQTH